MKSNTYSIVFHQGMKDLDVNHAEYCFLHYIYSLSTKTSSRVCYATKATIANAIGVSERSINEYIKKFYPSLINKSLSRHLSANSSLVNHFRNYENSAFEQRNIRNHSTQKARTNYAVSADNNKSNNTTNKNIDNVLITLKRFNFESDSNDLNKLNDIISKSNSELSICETIKKIFANYSGRPDQQLFLNTKYLLSNI